MEQRNLWLTFGSTTLGGVIFTLLTIPPASAMANLSGWLQLVSGVRLPPAATGAVAAIAVILAIVALVTSLLSFAMINMGKIENGEKILADMFKHAGRR